jgi:hypothetical protein
VLAQPFARLGQPDRARGAVHQRKPELLLERRNVVGDDGLRVAERERRLGEGAPLGDGVEGAQAPKVVHRQPRY